MIKTYKLPPFVYGLDGICKLFNVSRSTAFKLKNGKIAGAVTQHNNIILVDTAEALRLFGVEDAEKYIDPDLFDEAKK